MANRKTESGWRPMVHGLPGGTTATLFAQRPAAPPAKGWYRVVAGSDPVAEAFPIDTARRLADDIGRRGRAALGGDYRLEAMPAPRRG